MERLSKTEWQRQMRREENKCIRDVMDTAAVKVGGNRDKTNKTKQAVKAHLEEVACEALREQDEMFGRK